VHGEFAVSRFGFCAGASHLPYFSSISSARLITGCQPKKLVHLRAYRLASPRKRAQGVHPSRTWPHLPPAASPTRRRSGAGHPARRLALKAGKNPRRSPSAAGERKRGHVLVDRLRRSRYWPTGMISPWAFPCAPSTISRICCTRPARISRSIPPHLFQALYGLGDVMGKNLPKNLRAPFPYRLGNESKSHSPLLRSARAGDGSAQALQRWFCPDCVGHSS